MSISRSRLVFLGAALLLTATIKPASAVSSSKTSALPFSISTSMKCNDLSSVYQCCTDSGYCCYWYGDGSPICH